MDVKRDGFLFYRSYYEAIHSLPKKDRLLSYEALIEYALNGTVPCLSGTPAAVFTLVRPNLDASRRKAESGKKGGQSRGKPKANGKQNENKHDAIKDKGQEIEGQGIEEATLHPTAAVADYLDRVNPAASPRCIETLKAYEQEMGSNVCIRAIDTALDNGAAKWPYVKAILSKWQALGIKCLADIDLLDVKPNTSATTKPTAPQKGSGAYAADQKAYDERLARDIDAIKKLTESGCLN